MKLDFVKEDMMYDDELPFRAKFLMRTTKRDHTYFAKTDMERDIWLENLAKILESNRTGKFNLKTTAADLSLVTGIESSLKS